MSAANQSEFDYAVILVTLPNKKDDQAIEPLIVVTMGHLVASEVFQSMKQQVEMDSFEITVRARLKNRERL